MLGGNLPLPRRCVGRGPGACTLPASPDGFGTPLGGIVLFCYLLINLGEVFTVVVFFGVGDVVWFGLGMFVFGTGGWCSGQFGAYWFPLSAIVVWTGGEWLVQTTCGWRWLAVCLGT